MWRRRDLPPIRQSEGNMAVTVNKKDLGDVGYHMEDLKRAKMSILSSLRTIAMMYIGDWTSQSLSRLVWFRVLEEFHFWAIINLYIPS